MAPLCGFGSVEEGTDVRNWQQPVEVSRVTNVGQNGPEIDELGLVLSNLHRQRRGRRPVPPGLSRRHVGRRDFVRVEFGERSSFGDQVCKCGGEGGAGYERVLGFVLQSCNFGIEKQHFEAGSPAQPPSRRSHFKHQFASVSELGPKVALKLASRASKSSCDSPASTTHDDERPCLKLFCADLARPSGVTGPCDFAPLMCDASV